MNSSPNVPNTRDTQASALPLAIVALGLFAFTINELGLVGSDRKASLFSPKKRVAASPILEPTEASHDWSKIAF